MTRRPIHPLAAAALCALPWPALACGPFDNAFNFRGDGEGGNLFIAANVGAPFGAVVPFGGGVDLKCGLQTLTQTVQAPAASGTLPAQILLQAAAQGGDGAVHARAKSTVIDATPLAGRNSTPAVFADAATILRFEVLPRSGFDPAPVRLSFEITGDGTYGGTGLGSEHGFAGFNLHLRSTGSAAANTARYNDSTGLTRSSGNSEISFFSDQPWRIAELGITHTATFGSGVNSLQLDLFTFAWGTANADFENTGRIAGISVLTPGYDLALPDGLFTADAQRPGHYTLSALLPAVPEPASGALWLAGLMGLAWRARRPAWRTDAGRG